MGFRSGADNLVRIGSFDDAARYFETTPAIRGYDKDYNGVPLRSDRKHHDTRRLRKVTTPDGVEYHAILYRTPVVKWLQDGSVLVDLSYNTQTTMAFANRYLHCMSHRLYASIRFGYGLLQCDSKYYVGKHGETFRLVRTVTGAYRVDESTATQMVVPRLNSQRGAAVRRELKPFKQYVNTLIGLNGDVLMVDDADRDALRDSDDPFFRMLVEHAEPSWSRQINLPETYKRVVDAQYRRSGAYDLVPLPLGEVHPRMKRATS